MKQFSQHSSVRQVEDREQILSSVVSLYLYMSRSAGHRDQEIAFIDHLLRGMFGSNIPLHEIEQAHLSSHSPREAANQLSKTLNPGDRIKLILNLISLAYHHRSQIQVLGSMEIVSLADLLRLDVNILDPIYDLFEGSSRQIVLPDVFREKGYLKNSMYWGSGVGELKTSELSLHFLMVEDLILIRNMGKSNLQIIDQTTQYCFDEQHYQLLSNGQTLSNGVWQLDSHDLWHIYRKLDSIDSLEAYLDQRLLLSPENQKEQDYFVGKKAESIGITSSRSDSSLLRITNSPELLQIENLSNLDIKLNMKTIKGCQPFAQNRDIISILGRNYIVNRHFELIEIPLIVQELKVQDLWHYFENHVPALRGISFNLQKSMMMAIMGPSGSGKTTLLQMLLGELKSSEAKVYLDGRRLSENLEMFQQYIAYVPQDDLLFANLTVYENLYFKLRLCLPELKDSCEIQSRILNQLRSVDLYEQRNMIVGDVMNKKLSGGQRRRLNIALELITGPAILILDEPTSGLSTKDSESIIQLLSELSDQGKIIISTIHQPNASIYRAFDKVLLMDKGGVQSYYGNAGDAFDYFVSETNQIDDPILHQKLKLRMPELFFDIIEYRDPSGRRIYEPEYWEKKHRDFSFMQTLSHDSEPSHATLEAPHKKKERSIFRNLNILFRRNFLNKSRNPLNLIMTLCASPLLALLTAFVLRSAESSYNYHANPNAVLFDFIAVIVFIFIGLANSIDDIISEKRIIQRERKLGIKAPIQLGSRHLVLLLMSCLQALLFYLVAALILDMRGFFWPKFVFYTLSGVMGYSLGLMFSSLIKSRAAIINILPLVIIPQIMFSGVVIEFSKMNPMLRIGKSSDIPEFCHLIPSRWLVEGLVISSVKNNQLAVAKDHYTQKRKHLIQTGAMTAKLSLDMADDFQQFLDQHPPASYSNQSSYSLVNIAHGRFLRRNRNAFFSYRMKILGKEYSTIWIDLLGIMLMILAACSMTLYQLRRI